MKKLIFIFCMLFSLPALAANKVTEIKTPGGFTVWLVEEHSLPIIAANVSFTGSGMAYDPAGKEGRGNMTAALLLEGAGSLDAKAFNEALENDAIQLSIGADDDMVHASLQTLTVHKQTAFNLLSDALSRPRFDADAIERARAKMQAILIEQSESPYYKLSRGWQQSAYGTHPYGRMGLGSKESLATLTADDFRNMAKRYLTKSNIVISVVGDISASEVSTMIDKAFKDLPAIYAPDSDVPEITLPAEANTTIIRHDMPQTMISFGVNGLKRTDADYIPAYVVNYLIGGNGLSSRLGSEIRVKRGLAYSVNTRLEPKARAATWRGMFATKNKEAKTAIAVLKETLAAYAKEGPTEAELADAKAYLTGSFVLDLSSNGEVADFISVMQIYGLGSDYLEKRNGLIEKVSLADVKRVSNRFMDPARLRLVVVGQPEL